MSGDDHNNTTEPTYTLDEARREIARQQCRTYGHDWNIIATLQTGPVRIVCDSCGWSGDVKMRARGEVGS